MNFRAYSGIWDTVQNLLSGIGVSTATAAATARAFASPTLDNIRAVESAFASEGTSAPPELLDVLYKRYADAIARYPVAYGGGIVNTFAEIAPWLFIGGVAIYMLSKRGR
jgi:hypothetical protein